jgi:uncharacterized HAD superfamily protein/NTP pyrophosphatase (non-canonical NTP hydrolase)
MPTEELEMNFDELYEAQRKYNDKIFLLEGSKDKIAWTRQYLLGIVSEIGSVLDGINWKRHRNAHKEIIPENVEEEISDLFKYVLSLALLWDIQPQELLDLAYQKGEILEAKLRMEFSPEKINKKILIVDLDGTICDHAESFRIWLRDVKKEDVPRNISSLLMDRDLNINYPRYYALKDEFERYGGYCKYTLAYADAIDQLHKMASEGWFIILVTSRPSEKYHRIYNDTLNWLLKQNIPFNELLFMKEERLLLAEKLARVNEVIVWEDDPTILRRFATIQGIKVFARIQPYNKDMEIAKNTKFVSLYTEE